MITAEEMRNELQIDSNASLKTILIDYFNKAFENYTDKKDNNYLKTQYGIIDVKVEKILNKYGITSKLIDSKILKDEIEEFVKYVKSLGYIIQCKKTIIDDYSISIAWINGFESKEIKLVPNFIINKDNDVEDIEEEIEDNSND